MRSNPLTQARRPAGAAMHERGLHANVCVLEHPFQVLLPVTCPLATRHQPADPLRRQNRYNRGQHPGALQRREFLVNRWIPTPRPIGRYHRQAWTHERVHEAEEIALGRKQNPGEVSDDRQQLAGRDVTHADEVRSLSKNSFAHFAVEGEQYGRCLVRILRSFAIRRTWSEVPRTPERNTAVAADVFDGGAVYEARRLARGTVAAAVLPPGCVPVTEEKRQRGFSIEIGPSCGMPFAKTLPAPGKIDGAARPNRANSQRQPVYPKAWPRAGEIKGLQCRGPYPATSRDLLTLAMIPLPVGPMMVPSRGKPSAQLLAIKIVVCRSPAQPGRYEFVLLRPGRYG